MGDEMGCLVIILVLFIIALNVEYPVAMIRIIAVLIITGVLVSKEKTRVAEEEQRKRTEIIDKMKLKYQQRKDTIRIPDNTLTVYHRSGFAKYTKRTGLYVD